MSRIEDLRFGARDRIAYVPPTEEEAEAYRNWLARAAASARDDAPIPDGVPPGFVLELLPGAPDLWLLCERPGARRGAGAVVLRRGHARPVVFEAPHTFFDQGTLAIALEAFESQRARALVVNTVHRFGSGSARGRGPEQVGRETALPGCQDVAHAELSFFLAAHEAWLTTDPAILAVQLHGFAEDSASGATVIVSAAGSVASVPRARLRDVVGDGVRVFPDEIRRLGGTRNVQARASRRAGAPFLHVEIARSLRDRLVADASLAKRFASALMPPDETIRLDRAEREVEKSSSRR